MHHVQGAPFNELLYTLLNAIITSSYQVQESVKSAQFRVRTKQENVSGVMLPTFESYLEGGNGMLIYRYLTLIIYLVKLFRAK